jgi:hypothetical protein
MLSCRMLGRNAALTMKKTEIPEFLPIRSLSIRCPMCHANPKQVCIGGALELVHIARIKAAAKLDEARKTGRNDLADQLVQPTLTR